jgi:hypothetical protein
LTIILLAVNEKMRNFLIDLMLRFI